MMGFAERKYLLFITLVCLTSQVWGEETTRNASMMYRTVPALETAPKLSRTEDISPYIISGSVAQKDQFPHQCVIIVTGSSGSWLCGASLCGGNRWILTAAHCTEGAKSLSARCGCTSISSGGVYVYISTAAFKVHPNYNSQTLNNDIAMHQLPYALNSTANATVASIPLAPFSVNCSFLIDYLAEISGFGRTSDTSGSSSVLRYGNVMILNNTFASNYYGATYVTPKHICTKGAGNTNTSTCQGDSGGPLCTKINGINYQVGLVSFGSSEGCAFGYSCFTCVCPFIDWINGWITGTASGSTGSGSNTSSKRKGTAYQTRRRFSSRVPQRFQTVQRIQN